MDPQFPCPCCGTPLAAATATCPVCRCTIESSDAGKLLRNGELRLVRRLGHGGMAALHLAEVVATGELRVVKEMRGAADRRSRVALEQMFHDEAALLDMLSRRDLAVPHYYDSFMDSGAFYMVLEFVPGQNLGLYLEEQGGRLSAAEATGYALQAAAVLAPLHALQPHPIIHGDIKPSNLIRRPDGRIILIDFGLSRLDAPMPPYVPVEDSAFGTPGYSPPEQWEGHPGPLSDVFSLGATLHQLITGRNPRAPFAGRARLSRAELSMLTSFPPLGSLVSDAPPMLDLLVGQMLRRRPAERPCIREVQTRLARIAGLLAP